MSIIRAAIASGKNYGDYLPTDGGRILWRRRLAWKDFQAAATTSDTDIIFPSGTRITAAFIGLITAFSGGAVSACTLSAGTTGSVATYLGATNVFTGATAAGNITVAAGAGLGNFLGGNATPTVVGTVRFRITTTTANAAALTAGAVDVYLELQAASVKIA